MNNIKINTGVDIVNINRIKNILSKNRESFYNKIFTEYEIRYIVNKNHSPQTVSGLFASKEAISKALGTGVGKIGWRDMEVLHNEKGKPYVNIRSKMRERMNELEINNIEISISHEKDFAIAFAIAY